MKRLTKLISGMPTAMTAVLILICAGLVLAFTTKEETAILEAAFDQQQYASHMERKVSSIDHIVDQYLLDQTGYLPVATPDPDFIHIESGGILPFDPKDFPRDFTQNLLPQTKGVITTYEIIVYEDRKTRERKILNSRNKIIATVKAEKGYDPMWYVKACYENVLLSDDKERIQWLTQVYDPSRIAIRYQLIEKDELIELVWEDSLQAIERTEDEGGMLLGGRSGASVTNFSFIATEPLTNGTVQLTLAWPTNGLSTNAIDIFVSTNMLEEIWQIALTTNLSTDTNTFTWIDTDACDHPARFYDCWTLHDTDGDGLSDGRERRLYLTDPQDADTDDDGMPDGWEVQYGLDPLDATGGNGANGDPDGDGFTNLQEFQMGGDPANPAINATQLIHRLMHCRGDSSLRVDVEDSENCGGTNTNRQEVEDVFNVGPLMHCGYLLSLTVEGRVEDHNSGYDKVSVRVYTATELQSEAPFFEGHNNGNACAMVDEQATTNVWFWSNSSVRLRYDTVDGLYHTDAYAEITAAAFVDIIKVDFEAQAGKINYGFEPEETVRDGTACAWASVDKDDVSDVVKFEVEPAAAADQIELVVVSGSGSADISPKTFTAGSTALTITGQGTAGDAVVEARIIGTGQVCAKLNVMALPKQGSIGVGIYRIWDSQSPGTAIPAGTPSDADIISALNERFRQAQIEFELDGSSGVYDFHYDTLKPPYTVDGWTSGADGKWQYDESVAFLDVSPSPWTADVKLFILGANGDTEYFYVSKPTYPSYPLEGYMIDDPFDHVMMFGPPSVRPFLQVMPHEVGHVFDLAVYNDDGGSHDLGPKPTGTEKMMRNGVLTGPASAPVYSEFGKWIRHEDWRKANDKAFIINSGP